MRKLIGTLVLTITVSALMVSTAHAKNEFEDGFKYEMGAIAARSAIGLGVGLVTGVIHVEPYYAPPVLPVYVEPYYAPPARPVYVEPYYRPYRRPIYVERRVYHPRRHWARDSHRHQYQSRRHDDRRQDRHGRDYDGRGQGHNDRGRDHGRH